MPARTQGPKDAPATDSFGSLVDSNTQAMNTNASAQDNAPRRSDADKGPRDNTAADQPAPRNAADQADAPARASDDSGSDATAGPAQDAGKDADKDKAQSSDAASADKPDRTKRDDTKTTDGLSAAIDAAAAPADAAQPTVPDPNAIVVAAPVVPTDPALSANSGAAASPLAIAAAGLAASASTAAQIAGTKTDSKTDTATAADKTAKTAGATVDAGTTATLGDAAAATPDANAGEAKANGGLVAVQQGHPKASFQAVVAAQGQADVSNIGQGNGNDAGKAAATPAPGTANPAAHLQGLKPQADAGASDTKPATADRSPDAAPVTPAGHAQLNAQVASTTVDASTQAAAAVQAPLTTTSAATASTATLTATAATSATVPVNGIPVEIAAAFRSGKSRFDISLDPAELGRIDVRIHVDRNGNVTSHLTVEKPETLQMLRQDAPQLQRALDDAGLKSGSNGLSFSLRDQNSSGQNSGQNDDNGGNARRLIISEDDSIAAAPVGRGYGRMLGSSNGVDIRV